MTRMTFLRRMLGRHGSEMVVTVPGESPVTMRAMIQAMNYKDKVHLDDVQMPGGYLNDSHFFHIGPPDCKLDQMNGVILRCAEKEYKVIRAQGFLAGNRALCVRAILRELPEEETDGGI